MFDRYAIYYTPTGPLATQGAAWLGWDSAQGQRRDHPALDGLDIDTLTQNPRKYGLHGTLKPPFHLAQGTTAETLQGTVADLAKTLTPAQMTGLAVTRLGGFLALTPTGDQTTLTNLAARVVMELDQFRAPPTEAELARRRQASLSPAQDKHLNDWGYPYVLDQFRFHMTLTGRVKDPDTLLPLVAQHFAPVLPATFVVDALTLLGQKSDGMFYQIARFPCAG